MISFLQWRLHVCKKWALSNSCCARKHMDLGNAIEAWIAQANCFGRKLALWEARALSNSCGPPAGDRGARHNILSRKHKLIRLNVFEFGHCENLDILHRRLEGGEHGNVHPPPEIGKNCCRNLVLFSKALFIATTFPDLVGKSFFLLTFLPKFSKFS